MINKPEILKPSDLKETLKQSSDTDKGSKTLDQWINLVDKANTFITSIQTLSKNLKTTGVQQQETQTAPINKIETAYNQGVQQGRNENIPMPVVEIAYKNATEDLIQKLNALQLVGITDDKTIAEFKKLIMDYKESGALENKIHEWIEQFVSVRQ